MRPKVAKTWKMSFSLSSVHFNVHELSYRTGRLNLWFSFQTKNFVHNGLKCGEKLYEEHVPKREMIILTFKSD